MQTFSYEVYKNWWRMGEGRGREEEGVGCQRDNGEKKIMPKDSLRSRKIGGRRYKQARSRSKGGGHKYAIYPKNKDMKLRNMLKISKLGWDTRAVGCSFSCFSCTLVCMSPFQAQLTALPTAPQDICRKMPEFVASDAEKIEIKLSRCTARIFARPLLHILFFFSEDGGALPNRAHDGKGGKRSRSAAASTNPKKFPKHLQNF